MIPRTNILFSTFFHWLRVWLVFAHSASRMLHMEAPGIIRVSILGICLLVTVRGNYAKDSFTVFRNTVDKEDFATIGGAILNGTGTGFTTAVTICLRHVLVET